MTNYFATGTAAERYARARPNFHPQVIALVRAFLRIEEPVPVALDVACGTGLSTVALTALATEVIGVDPSAEMLARAPRLPNVRYLNAPAEALPLPDQSVDLVTVCCALHWFDRAAFLAETWRVLRPGGRLVVYTNGFRGRMESEPTFGAWVRDVYAVRYPTPPRDRRPFGAEEATQAGFRWLGSEEYTNVVPFTEETLADYLTTQSNVIARVEGGSESIESARAWLHEQLAPFFARHPVAEFAFGGKISYAAKDT